MILLWLQIYEYFSIPITFLHINLCVSFAVQRYTFVSQSAVIATKVFMICVIIKITRRLICQRRPVDLMTCDA